MGAKAEWFDYIERFGAAVICAIEDGADWQTQGQPEFVAGGPCACGASKVGWVTRRCYIEGESLPRLDILFVGWS
jgi:hypothetical protein